MAGCGQKIHTGDVIVATEVRGPRGVLALSCAAAIAEALRSAGLNVHVGPIVSSERLAFGGRRARLAADGAIGVDMESYWLLEAYIGRSGQPGGAAATLGAGLSTGPGAGTPPAGVAPGAASGNASALGQAALGQAALVRAVVVRTVSDTAGERFLGGMLPLGWLRAYRSLARVGVVLEEWAGCPS